MVMSSDDLLREKAILLIRRERELHEFRQERGRIETWLKAFHLLSLNLGTTDRSFAFDLWVDSMIGPLAFQVANVHTYNPETGKLALLCTRSPGDAPPPGTIDATALDYLNSDPSGTFSSGAPVELAGLSEALRLEMFYWMVISGRSEPLILSAGFVPGNGCFRAITQQDAIQFALLGNHLAALLDNIALLNELDREKLELSASNQKLEETQGKLLQSARDLAEVSRRAGMADVATGVLHNVGNALNSVNVAAGVIESRLKALRLTGLGRAATFVRDQANSAGSPADERAPKLAHYLDELSAHLSDERDGMLKELASLQSHIEHIKAIVSKQQSYAVTFDVSQPCVASELADDAIALNQSLLQRLNISVERRYEPVQELVTDRHKVLQILVNLVSNAKHALSKVERPDRVIVVSVAPSQALEGIAISVSDNGIGIRAEDHERLFNYGFTTRKTGHGFGLHMSSLAARELGGKLSAKSAGESQGATFVLDLPFGKRSRDDPPRD
jgi:two-component system, NtrC family, sensor kinase